MRRFPHGPARTGAPALVVIAALVVASVSAVGPSAPEAEAGVAAKKRRTTTRVVSRTVPRTPTTLKAATTRPGVSTGTTVVSPVASPPVLPVLDVSTRTETFIDTSRPTAAAGTTPAKSSRTLETLVVAPTVTGRTFPLFVFGHGLGGRPAQYEQLLRRIASAGFVVAAPTFPLSNTNAPGGPSLFDEPNQPGDMSFVITKMFTNAQVNPELVFVGGHSLGGITTVDLIGNPTLVDRRVDAAVVVSGTANLLSSVKLFQNTPSIPVLFLHGDADATVPIGLGRSTFAAARTPKWFVTVLGGNHVFGIDAHPELTIETGLLYTDAVSTFLSSVNAGPDRVTRALDAVVASAPKRLTIQSVVE